MRTDNTIKYNTKHLVFTGSEPSLGSKLLIVVDDEDEDVQEDLTMATSLLPLMSPTNEEEDASATTFTITVSLKR